MGYWSVIVPEATKNYIPNPSFEVGTAGYSSFTTGTAAGTRVQSLAWQKRDAYSYKIVKSSGGATDQYGFYAPTRLPSEFVSGDYCTFSVDLHITAGTVRVRLEVDQGTTLSAESDETADGRYSVTVGPLTNTATAIRAYVYIVSATGTFYADGLQVERKAYATTYCDGTRKGCVWNGAPHNSTSSRSAQSRAGGREVNLADLGYGVLTMPGIGMPPISHYSFPQASLPGALLRGYRVNVRAFTLTVETQPMPVTYTGLHSVRKALIDAIKPDRTKDFDTFPLRYTGANDNKVAEIMVAYDAGLEYTERDGFSEKVPLRLIAYDPLWHEDGDVAVELAEQVKTASFVGCALRRKDGIWASLGASFNDAVYAIAEGRDGIIYFGGKFTDVGNGIVGYDPDSGSFYPLGTGVPAGSSVYSMAAAPNGDLYVGGSFTSMGGVANTARLARWNHVSQVWESIATSGADGIVYDLVFDQAGDLYVTGDFDHIDGAAYAKIAKYVISTDTWSALGTGLSGAGKALAVSPDNVLFVGGNFATANGVTVNNVAYWNGTTFAALGAAGTNGQVNDLLFAADGTLYLCGSFTQCAGTAGYNRVAGWNGVSFLTLGDGFSATTYFLGMDAEGLIYTSGTNTFLKSWNGSIWSIADIVLPDNTGMMCMKTMSNGVVYLGHASLFGDAFWAAQTTVTNTGTVTAYPKVVIGSAQHTVSVQWLRNNTTGDTIYLDYDLLAGETLTLDFTPNVRTVTSSYFGQVWRAVQQNSQFSTFRLLPGDNQISLFVYTANSYSVDSYIQWQNAHWSADGVAA